MALSDRLCSVYIAVGLSIHGNMVTPATFLLRKVACNSIPAKSALHKKKQPNVIGE
jgi:hypothetical protein